MPKLSPEERRYKRDHILARIGQLLEREFNKAIATPLDVAKLAIELARLNGDTDATKFTDDAVNLLRKSAVAINKPTPDAWTKEKSLDWLIEHFTKSEETNRVAYAQLVKLPGEEAAPEPFTAQTTDGKTVTFTPYSSEKGFVVLLRKYAAGQYEEHRATLMALLSRKEPAIDGAIAFVRQHSHGNSEKEVEAIKRGFKSKKLAEQFAQNWAQDSQQRFVKVLLAEAKTGALSNATATALFNLRNAETTKRNQTAADTRRKKLERGK